MNANIYITRRIPETALRLLKDSFETVSSWAQEETAIPRNVLLEKVQNCDGLLAMLTDKIDKELLDNAPSLKIVANMAVGYDNIDVPLCTKRGILVTNTPGVLTETTADLTFALILATARRLFEARDFLIQDKWKTWAPMLLTGQDVRGATLGILGLGRIGQAVARRAQGFQMNIIYHSRRRDLDAEKSLGIGYREKDDLLLESDFLSVHVPLTPETKGMIGERELKMMKPTAILINTSRGAVVDENALVKALKEGWIWAAGLDVFEKEPLPSDSPLRTLSNIVLLPHIGSASIKTRTEMALIAAQNIKNYLIDGIAKTPVNPEVISAME